MRPWRGPPARAPQEGVARTAVSCSAGVRCAGGARRHSRSYGRGCPRWGQALSGAVRLAGPNSPFASARGGTYAVPGERGTLNIL